MNTLTKDDYYEIEKICDFYSAEINKNLTNLCHVAVSVDGSHLLKTISKEVSDETYSLETEENPLRDSILELKKCFDRVKEIRDKLQAIRLEENK
jgi:hypothetical protein